MSVEELRIDIAKRNKSGIAFILASIIIWTGILVVWRLPIDNIVTQNLLTFMLTTPMMPLAFVISKIIKAEFSAKNNPLHNLGFLFSMNQMLYVLIAMWAYNAAPENMVMILAIIFGAHLMPFGWLYKSKAYTVMSVIIPLGILIVGFNLKQDQIYVIPCVMLGLEIIFSLWLAIENKKLASMKTTLENV
ncbi:DUF7010 family protein [Alkaliphilus hydrothermalis]|uniref:Glucan phosphoethanolaminetransferase (Alkaline phosphatase superfamily) n=1 Tax=Alkaliphilus hydrothermalis TaxID=1482730 RepID=A0ABS2NTI4_9FIRM|nr:hypothetical protein [Alkaliphilus hydrothermalis]MBM7616294.1 glucan phosphoethanolaminetransferase (alkaline phosphatase superfamily) [Alkaliphilus hydrothermalis]